MRSCMKFKENPDNIYLDLSSQIIRISESDFFFFEGESDIFRNKFGQCWQGYNSCSVRSDSQICTFLAMDGILT
jgi:hypothetical protein